MNESDSRYVQEFITTIEALVAEVRILRRYFPNTDTTVRMIPPILAAREAVDKDSCAALAIKEGT